MVENSPVFIGGLMKSGTTLLRVLLGRHSNLYSGMETHWFSDDFLLNWQDSSTKGQKLFRDLYDFPDEVYEEIKNESSNGIDFFSRLMNFCTVRAGKNRWIEKSPDNIIHSKLIHENWPDSRLIHVVRDYRDVYASWKRKGKYNIDQFIENVKKISDNNSALIGTQTEFYIEIDYELLVRETSDSLRSVISHIGENWEDGLEKYEGDRTDFERLKKVTGQKSLTLESISKPIFTNAIGQWRNILDKNEVRKIENELGDLMKIWKWL